MNFLWSTHIIVMKTTITAEMINTVSVNRMSEVMYPKIQIVEIIAPVLFIVLII